MKKPSELFELFFANSYFSNLFDFFFSNFFFIMLFVCFTIYVNKTKQTFFIDDLQTVYVKYCYFILNKLEEQTGSIAQRFFPFILTVFLFILFFNVFALVLATFSITGQLFTTFTLNILNILFLLNFLDVNNLIYILLIIQLYFNVIFLVPTIGHIKMYLVYKLGEKYYHYFAKNFVIIFLIFIFLLYLNMINFISYGIIIYLILLSILFVLGNFLFNTFDPKNITTSNFLFDIKINIVTVFCGLNLRVILTFLFSEESVCTMGINIFALLKKSNEENSSFLSKISLKVVGFCKKLFGSFFNFGKNDEKSPVKEETVISKPEEKPQQQQQNALYSTIVPHKNRKHSYIKEHLNKIQSTTILALSKEIQGVKAEKVQILKTLDYLLYSRIFESSSNYREFIQDKLLVEYDKNQVNYDQQKKLFWRAKITSYLKFYSSTENIPYFDFLDQYTRILVDDLQKTMTKRNILVGSYRLKDVTLNFTKSLSLEEIKDIYEAYIRLEQRALVSYYFLSDLGFTKSNAKYLKFDTNYTDIVVAQTNLIALLQDITESARTRDERRYEYINKSIKLLKEYIEKDPSVFFERNIEHDFKILREFLNKYKENFNLSEKGKGNKI